MRVRTIIRPPRRLHARRPDTEERRSSMHPHCIIPGCELPVRVKSRGLCNAHHLRLSRYGDPLAGGASRPMGRTLLQRFWARVKKSSGCWEWIGGRDAAGYGALNVQGAILRVHVLSYWLHHGAIPTGKIICHHCDNPPCVNPSHIYAGTVSSNTRDMIARGRAAPQVGHVREWAERKRRCVT